MSPEAIHTSPTRPLDAAMLVVRAKGYADTAVDDICDAAGVTMAGFLHRFRSTGELAISTVDHCSSPADGLFGGTPCRAATDPFDCLWGNVDFRTSILTGQLPRFTCLLGTLVQEPYGTHPDIRATCDRGMSAHVAALTRDVAQAKALFPPDVRRGRRRASAVSSSRCCRAPSSSPRRSRTRPSHAIASPSCGAI
jgi:TetR/AcrR family transcriptional repressor of nem operon